MGHTARWRHRQLSTQLHPPQQEGPRLEPSLSSPLGRGFKALLPLYRHAHTSCTRRHTQHRTCMHHVHARVMYTDTHRTCMHHIHAHVMYTQVHTRSHPHTHTHAHCVLFGAHRVPWKIPGRLRNAQLSSHRNPPPPGHLLAPLCLDRRWQLEADQPSGDQEAAARWTPRPGGAGRRGRSLGCHGSSDCTRTPRPSARRLLRVGPDVRPCAGACRGTAEPGPPRPRWGPSLACVPATA